MIRTPLHIEDQGHVPAGATEKVLDGHKEGESSEDPLTKMVATAVEAAVLYHLGERGLKYSAFLVAIVHLSCGTGLT